MRPLVVAAVAAATLWVGPALASADEASNVLVRPGLGVGELRLGMTLGEARRALGRAIVPTGAREPVSGVVFRRYRTADGLWELALLGPRGRERVARIVSTGGARTRGGAGVGIDLAAVPRRLLPLDATCRVRAVFLNYRLHGVRTTHCAVVGADAVTGFQGRGECAVVPARYQGCPRIKVEVASVIVESVALQRYGLAWWPARDDGPGLVGNGVKEPGGKARVESDEKNLLRRMVT